MALQVRRSNYRGREGWLICGKREGYSWPASVFVEGTREYAQRVKARMLAGKEDIFTDEGEANG